MERRRRSRRWWAGQAVAFVAFAATVAAVGGLMAMPAKADPNEVLILGSTVSGGATSVEGMAASALGYGVDVVDDATWAAMTTADFANYRAIILGDPFCSTTPSAAAEANRTTWGPAINGNVVVNGTDPTFHSTQGGAELIQSSVAFAVDAAGKTGMYMSLSCYYNFSSAGTAVPMLEPFGTFTVTGNLGCYNDSHIVASHPALAGLTDEMLSNWSCSVHEAFDSWPTTGPGAFTVLAIAENIGTVYTAPDGTVGTPYIMARGEGLAAGDISLNPATGTAAADGVTQQCMTALITSGGAPQSGKTVSFSIVSGPNAGASLADGVTGTDGTVERCYTSTLTGTDTIEASFTEGATTQTSNQVTREWTGDGPPPPTGSVVEGKGRFNTGTGQVEVHMTEDSVSLSKRRGSGAFAFTGDVVSTTGTGNEATVSGTGTFNGVAGHTFSVEVVDNGSRRESVDSIDVVIRDAAGAIVFSSGGPQPLQEGNLTVTPATVPV